MPRTFAHVQSVIGHKRRKGYPKSVRCSQPAERTSPGLRALLKSALTLLCVTATFVASHAQAPTPALPPNSASNQIDQTGTISGFITDSDGNSISGARITLSIGIPGGQQTTVSGDDGSFAFNGIPAQSYKIAVTAKGFGPSTQTGVLQSGSTNDLSIKLAAATNINVDVSSLSQEEIAEEEIHIEETQRIAGIVPNFFVSYNWNAAPLSARQKFELAAKNTIDPVTFFVIGGTAGFEQAENHLKGYGQGAMGYAKRFGSNFGDTTIGTFVGGAILPSILHQDPRYFYMGPQHTIPIRALYALSTAVICRGDNGRWQPNYSGVLGDIAGGAASNIYYPASDRTSASTTFENGLVNALLDGAGNLLQEFIFHSITPHLNKTPPPTTTNP